MFKPVPGRRNEALDCMAYNVAALAVLNVRNWDALEKTQNASSREGTAEPDEPHAASEPSARRLKKQVQTLRRSHSPNWVTGVLRPGRSGWVSGWKL